MSPLLTLRKPPSSPTPQTSAAVAARTPNRFTAHGKDFRLYIGLALVLGSMLLGARVIASSDTRAQLWTAQSDLAAGTTLRADDLHAVAVGVDDPSSYVDSSTSLVGKVLQRPVGAGELIGSTAVGDAVPAKHRLVTIAVDPLHSPPGLARGERVDVYVTPADSASGPLPPTLMLSGALVADPGTSDASGSGQLGVVVDVSTSDAAKAVEAARGGQVDVVRVGEGQ